MGVLLVRGVRVALESEWEAAAAFRSSVIVGVGCPAGPVTVTAAVVWPLTPGWSSSALSLAAVMLPSFLTCSTKPSLFWVMTMSLLSRRQSSSSNSSGVPSVCSPLSCLEAAEVNGIRKLVTDRRGASKLPEKFTARITG